MPSQHKPRASTSILAPATPMPPTDREVAATVLRISSARREMRIGFAEERKIKKQIEALQQRSNEVAKNIMGNKLEVYDAERQACQELCAMLHEKLPRELRDMVYDDIIDPARDTKRLSHFHYSDNFCSPILENGTWSARTLQKLTDSGKYRTRMGLPWWSNDYTGENVSRELSERWYSTRRFQLDGSNGNSLPKFFLEDMFRKDLNPGALVRHIHMEVFADSFNSKWTKEDELLRNVQPLLLRGRKDMVIIFSNDLIRRRNITWRINQLEEVMCVIAPAFLSLRDAGFNNLTFCTKSPDLDLSHLVAHYPDRTVRDALYVPSLYLTEELAYYAQKSFLQDSTVLGGMARSRVYSDVKQRGL